MGICKICGEKSIYVSSYLGLCRNCILKNGKAVEIALRAHSNSRKIFELPEKIPRTKNGLSCGICGNNCKIGLGEKGFCGLVENRDGKLFRLAGSGEKGLCEWYYDPHVTNCVASWVCPAGTGCGYPRYARKNGPEFGFYNLAVFYSACNFNCLFCQNWHFREKVFSSTLISAEDLAGKVHERVSCICFFGGDPGPQVVHAIETARIAMKKFKNLRICMETNGNLNPNLLKEFAEISLESGGILKFDLKCWDEKISLALCGVSNKKVLKNFKLLSKFHEERKEVPFLHASTLLVPGYVNEEEVKKIARFIARIDKTIPYSLLAFYPTFLFSDLPFTEKEMALKCLKVAEEEGLEKVRIGNLHLLT
ncbi:MAG: radical SAM protein [Candidatus Aenigmatarchaeota archaeon]